MNKKVKIIIAVILIILAFVIQRVSLVAFSDPDLAVLGMVSSRIPLSIAVFTFAKLLPKERFHLLRAGLYLYGTMAIVVLIMMIVAVLAVDFVPNGSGGFTTV